MPRRLLKLGGELLLRAGAQVYGWLKRGREKRRLARLSERSHADRWKADLANLRIWIEGLEDTSRRAEAERRLFRRRGPLSFEERARLRGLWAALLDYLVAIDRLKASHAGFPGLAFGRTAHPRSYLLTYAAFVAQYRAGLRLIGLAGGNRAIETLLDEAAPELGLPAGRFAQLKWNVIHVADVAKVLVGRAYFALVRRRLRRDAEAAWAIGYLRRAVPRVTSHLARRAVGYFAAATLSVFRRRTFAAWFPLQREVARWMGRVVVKDRPPLVSPAQASRLATRLRPGDILVERRNWHLSNAGLPGFWPHAALYVGTTGEMARDLGEEFVARLRKSCPSKLAEFDRRPYRVIEAVSAGVVFKTIEESAGADYVGAMRPRRGAARAIERAFHYHGRPYDFDFDFTSDSALVCSELVWKCYQGSLRLALVPLAGRRVLPPTEIVRKFDRELGTPRQELAFAAFLDGQEGRRRAIERDAKAFRKTHLRPKWDFLQE